MFIDPAKECSTDPRLVQWVLVDQWNIGTTPEQMTYGMIMDFTGASVSSVPMKTWLTTAGEEIINIIVFDGS